MNILLLALLRAHASLTCTTYLTAVEEAAEDQTTNDVDGRCSHYDWLQVVSTKYRMILSPYILTTISVWKYFVQNNFYYHYYLVNVNFIWLLFIKSV